MPNPMNVLQAVRFDNDFDPTTLRYVEEDALLGNFLQVAQNGAHHSQVTLLGFGAPFAREGGFDQGRVVDPILELDEVPQKFRSIDLQGKGVGPRMYNTPQAALGYTALPPNHLNAYVFDICPSAVKDVRPSEGSTLQRIMKHASRIVDSRRRSLEGVVDDIHADYDDAGVVLMTQPPNAARRERRRREHDYVPEVPSEFLIIRSAIQLRKVGRRNHPSRPNFAS
ncbi:MAG: hypothetical protein JWP13_199 [Candidatus Saccharibacteria bacterium]|nr:hypothetical protein [Candidatus Saccharibacteria bacterium]